MSRRTIAVVALPLATIAALAAYLVAVRPRLPDTVAIHWGSDGRADGFASPDTIVWLFPVLCLVVWATTSGVGTIGQHSIAGGRLLGGLPLGAVWFVAALSVGTAAVQLDTAESPALPSWVILSALVAAAAGTALGVAVAGPARAFTSHVPGAETLWEGATPPAPVMWVLAAVAIVIGVGMAWWTEPWLLLVFLPIVVLLVASSAFRVVVGTGGMLVAARGIGFPRLRMAADEIAGAEPGEVQAWDFGGWGIRVGVKGQSAIVTRSGPALVVTRTDGQVLRVSLDHPEQAAAAITGLIGARR